MCDVIGQPQRRSPTSSTEIVGQIIDQSEASSADGNHSNIVALCTLEGTIIVTCVYIIMYALINFCEVTIMP